MNRRAFTLVELLTVLAVIGLLAAFATPAALHFFSQARQTKCASNLRQIGAGMILFAADHDGNLPETSHTTGVRIERSWIFTLKRYLANCDAVRISPADPLGAQRLKENGTSYILNSWVFVPRYGPFGELEESFANLRRLPLPAHTPLAFNISDEQSPAVLNDHAHCDLWAGHWDRVCRDIQPNRHRSGSDTLDHTNGTSNFLFADGHVATVAALILKKRIEEGCPVGKPPQETEDVIDLLQ